MDVQFYGTNCLAVSYKNTRIVIDDNLSELGKKSITKSEDVAIWTSNQLATDAKLKFSGPGEYEVGDISIVGISAKPFMNDDSGKTVTMYKLMTTDVNVLICGHILGDLNTSQLEQIGTIDVLCVPVGNNGYTLDPVGVLKLIKDIEPKIVIPTHYKQNGVKYPVEQIDLDKALKEIGMEVKERVPKLKIKSADLTDLTQLVVLESD